ncbi:MAG: aminoacetone oxidase family FAD-binding enzyme [Fimbriimonadaceae bacterium]|nr:aminoacetone oxidase family FAD-binding enzyme [Fimbriimonadaceae bacterium]
MAGPDVVIVGAGAAGIFAALAAAESGARVLLLEKTPRIGTKILISGNGKCNIAHDGPIEEVLKAFRPNEARFLRPSVYRMPNREILRIFTDRGLEVYTREDGRVFPTHQTARDVVQILRDRLDEAGVALCLDTPVKRILHDGGRVVGVETDEPTGRSSATRGSAGPAWGAKALLNEVLAERDSGGRPLGARTIDCSKVILAVGGSSYPNSGTTGDGYPWVLELGHGMVKIRGALAPIYLALEESPVEGHSGVAIRDALVKLRSGGREVQRVQRDLLITHQGLSGPAALFVSRVAAEEMERGDCRVEVDLLPSARPEQVQEDWIEAGRRNPHGRVANRLTELLPESLIEPFLRSAAIPTETLLGRLGKKERNRLVEALKGWNLGRIRAVPLEKGECVAGGVPLDEVDPRTMKSLRCEGLWICGELLDIAGPVGGYNLQAAFATGWAAGESAAG